jgi:hypothetical protein
MLVDNPNPTPNDVLSLESEVVPKAAWICIIYSLDMNTQTAKVYAGDTDITAAVTPAGNPFVPVFDGLPFWVFNDSFDSTVTGDFADVRIMPGVSLLTAGNISQATRRLFIGSNGKPINPTVATATLGAPATLFSGDAASFATNQGTAGAFTLTGSLTNASTSPSD